MTTMTTTHTPGPWTVSVGPHTTVNRADGAVLARVGGAINVRENARLIAAAPDMINALRVLEKMAQTTAKAFPNAPGVGDWQQAALIARAAIARATGAA